MKSRFKIEANLSILSIKGAGQDIPYNDAQNNIYLCFGDKRFKRQKVKATKDRIRARKI